MMMFFFLSFSSAQEMTPYSWLSSISTLQDFSSFSAQPPPDTMTKTSWDEAAPRGYAHALLSEPSLLSLLNSYQIEHKLLPSEADASTHDIIFFQQEGKIGQLMYREEKLETVFFAYERTSFRIDPSPFSSSRFSALEHEQRTLLSSCTAQQVIKQDSYGNALTWRGEDCFFGDLLLSYQPTHAYPIQAVFYAPY